MNGSKKIITVIGYLAIILLIFGVGYFVGSSQVQSEQARIAAEQERLDNERKVTEAKAQAQSDEVLKDIYNVTDKYRQLGDLCEEKYKTGLQGDITTALQIKGQMTAIQEEIDKTLQKYQQADNFKTF